MNNDNKAEKIPYLKTFDYEKYQLVLPYRFLFGRKRQRFIYSELEKMHPCFSSEFCFDSTLRKVSKKGFVSDVMVIHKNKLAEYEARRSLFAAGIGRITGTGFFAETGVRHRFFINEKFKRTFETAVFVAAAVLIFFVVREVGSLTETFGKENVQTFILSEGQKALQIEDGEKSRTKTYETIGKFFDCINEADGRILSFRWECLNGSEIVEARVKGVFPEQLEGLKLSAVRYEEGVPVIQVMSVGAVSEKMTGNHSGVSGGRVTSSSFGADFFKSVRSALIVNGGILKEERASPYMVRFSCNEKVMGTLLSDVDGIFADAGGVVCSVNILVAGGSSGGSGGNNAGDFEISIGGAEDAAPAPGIDLAVVAENADCFGEIKKKPKLVNQLSKQNPSEKENLEKADGQKIGEIKTSEGKVIVFYKTSDGKIKKIMEAQKK